MSIAFRVIASRLSSFSSFVATPYRRNKRTNLIGVSGFGGGRSRTPKNYGRKHQALSPISSTVRKSITLVHCRLAIQLEYGLMREKCHFRVTEDCLNLLVTALPRNSGRCCSFLSQDDASRATRPALSSSLAYLSFHRATIK